MTHVVPNGIVTVDETGLNGLAINEEWSSGAHAYPGLTVSGFPKNLLYLQTIVALGVCERIKHGRVVVRLDRPSNAKGANRRADVVQRDRGGRK
jgi:hypothetical protein